MQHTYTYMWVKRETERDREIHLASDGAIPKYWQHSGLDWAKDRYQEFYSCLPQRWQ